MSGISGEPIASQGSLLPGGLEEAVEDPSCPAGHSPASRGPLSSVDVGGRTFLKRRFVLGNGNEGACDVIARRDLIYQDYVAMICNFRLLWYL